MDLDGSSQMAGLPELDWSSFLTDGVLESGCMGWDESFQSSLPNGDIAGDESQRADLSTFTLHETDSDRLDDIGITAIDPGLIHPPIVARLTTEYPEHHPAALTAPAMQTIELPDASFSSLSLENSSAQTEEVVPARQEYPPRVDRSNATGKPRKSRANLPKLAVAILKAWLQEHGNDPYPSDIEKRELSARTGLETKQINYWFMNARKRNLNGGYNSSTSCSDAESLGSWTPVRGRSPQRLPTAIRGSSTDSLSSSLWCSDSEVSRPSKRGRKRRYSSDVPLNNRKGSRSTSTSVATNSGWKYDCNFQCTFCGTSLSSKSWRRHEETQHVPQMYWTCMATGSTLSDGNGSKTRCALCGEPGVNCTKDHRVDDCLNRPEKDRTFERKDHLRQHFRNFHPHSTLHDDVAAAWEFKNTATDRPWPCGFCLEILPNWNTREQHIANHFRQGSTMKSWSQNRTFGSPTMGLECELGSGLGCLDAKNNPSLMPPFDPPLRVLENMRLHSPTDPQELCFQCPCCDDWQGSLGYCKYHSSWPLDISFPFSISISFLAASEWIFEGAELRLWHCGKTHSLILYDAAHETLFRYTLESITCVALLDDRGPSANLRASFNQRPLQFKFFNGKWKALDSKFYASRPFIQEWTFINESLRCEFAAWLSGVRIHLSNENRSPLDCALSYCPLTFHSINASRSHRVFHEGAHVDIYGRRLCPTQKSCLSTSFHKYDVGDATLDMLTPTHCLEFKCGKLLPDGRPWGCGKLFSGASGFARHLKSSVGKICWTPLHLFHFSAEQILSLKRLGNELDDAQLQQRSSLSGLPRVLFLLYPALSRVENWDNLNASSHVSARLRV